MFSLLCQRRSSLAPGRSSEAKISVHSSKGRLVPTKMDLRIVTLVEKPVEQIRASLP